MCLDQCLACSKHSILILLATRGEVYQLAESIQVCSVLCLTNSKRQMFAVIIFLCSVLFSVIHSLIIKFNILSIIFFLHSLAKLKIAAVVTLALNTAKCLNFLMCGIKPRRTWLRRLSNNLSISVIY